MKKLQIISLLASVSWLSGNAAVVESTPSTPATPIKYKIKEKEGFIKVTFKANGKAKTPSTLTLSKEVVDQAFTEISQKYGAKATVIAHVKNKDSNKKANNKKKNIITSAEIGAFSSQSALHEVAFSNIPIIQTKTILNCPHLKKVIIGGTGTQVEKNILENCPELSGITVGGTSMALAESAFEKTAVETVNLGGTDLSVGQYAFANTPRLATVNIGGTAISIGEHAFSASAVQKLKVGGVDITLGNLAFENCTSLAKVNLGGVNVNVAPKAFDGCPQVQASNPCCEQ